MIKATCKLKSTAPFSFSKYVQTEKKTGETHEDVEARTWREKCHSNGNGNCKIPSNMFDKAIKGAAQYLSIKIPGEGTSKYTKNFKSGIMVMGDIDLGVTPEQISRTDLLVPSDGQVGGSKRVPKTFPIVDEWEGEISVLLMDPKITPDVFKEVLDGAGMFIGVGRWRPSAPGGGSNGRFKVVDVEFTETTPAEM